nr:SusD/RagB family nutrient-binding outer membrane lipoprotein [Parabacteroides goldsteinii]
MKKAILYAAAAFSLMTGATSCSDFGDVNNDPEQMTPAILDFKLVFTQVMSQACGSDWDVWRNGMIYSASMLQHTTSVTWDYGTFYAYSDGYNAAYWDGFYSGDRAAIRNAYLVMQEWKDRPEYQNEYQMCRIIRAFMFHRMTDLYGDVPYFDASKGIEGVGYPKYDTQQAIYNDLFKELDEAQAALSTSVATTVSNEDPLYGGDVTKWKKFANSLMLRLAMRLTKVDQATAETWVKKAISNGLFESAADNAMVKHPDGLVTDDSAEPYGKVLSHEDPQAFYLSEFFINMLKNSNDPRLPLIATVCSNPSEKWQGDFDFGDNDPSKQVGLPVGYDTKGNEWDLSNAPGYPGTNWRSYYSLPNRQTYARPDAPTMLLTYTENQLLLAEAAYRGWISGNAKDYYEAGVRSAMQQFSFYPAAESSYNRYLNAEAIEKYLAENPFDQSKALEQINTQYYITTFCDEYETFANWRRSGYPVLTPVNKNYSTCVTNGTIPRRFQYPVTESQNNEANYQDAIGRMNGGDRMTSRVWWDKE